MCPTPQRRVVVACSFGWHLLVNIFSKRSFSPTFALPPISPPIFLDSQKKQSVVTKMCVHDAFNLFSKYFIFVVLQALYPRSFLLPLSLSLPHPPPPPPPPPPIPHPKGFLEKVRVLHRVANYTFVQQCDQCLQKKETNNLHLSPFF